MENNKEKIEVKFNNMNAILERLNRITYLINGARQQRNYNEMLDFVTDYFKEISGDLTPKELNEYWEKIKLIKRFCNPLIAENSGRVLNMLDELDISLRVCAKSHGFLTQNKPTEERL